MEDHETLTLHCEDCMSNSMMIQVSESHGLVIACNDCKKPAMVIEDGEAFDALMHKTIAQGCTMEGLHDHGKN